MMHGKLVIIPFFLSNMCEILQWLVWLRGKNKKQNRSQYLGSNKKTKGTKKVHQPPRLFQLLVVACPKLSSADMKSGKASFFIERLRICTKKLYLCKRSNYVWTSWLVHDLRIRDVWCATMVACCKGSSRILLVICRLRMDGHRHGT